MTNDIAPESERQIESAFERYADVWKTNDGSSVASVFGESGSLVNPFGERVDGRDAIANMYTGYFGGMLAKTTTAFDVRAIRAAGTGHAFVDAEQRVFGPDGEVVLALHLMALLQREGDTWGFVDVRAFAPLSR